MTGSIRRITVGWWLTAVVLTSTVAHLLLNLDQHAPGVFPDEIIYSELGRSLSESGDLAVRGFTAHSYPPIYPAVLAPVYAAFNDLGSAYRVILTLNSLLMSLAAVPAYLLARRITSRGPALVAAVLTVAIPSMTYTRFVMTESLFYPLFLVFVYVLFLALENPTPRRQLLLIATMTAAGLTRFQAVALVPAVATAILLLTFSDGSRARSTVVAQLRRYWPVWSVFAVGGVVLLVAQLARGKGLLAPPGSYGGLKHDFGPLETARWLAYHVAELDLFLGFIPFMVATFVALGSLKTSSERRLKIFACIALATTFWIALLAAGFASQSDFRYVEERYVFYIAPLFFVLLLVAIERKLIRPRRPFLILAAVVGAALPALAPLTSYTHLAAIGPQALVLRPLGRLQGEVGATHARALVLLAGMVAAGLVLTFSRRHTGVLVASTLIFLIGVQAYVEKTFRDPSLNSSAANATRWVDDHVNGTVAVAWTGTSDLGSLWFTAFFNRRVGPIYNIGPPALFQDTPAAITARGFLRSRSGAFAAAPYVLADRNLLIAGRPLIRNPQSELTLYRTTTPIVVTGQAFGLLPPIGTTQPLTYPNLGWSSSTFGFRRYACRGGAIQLELLGNPFIGSASQHVAVSGAGARKAINLRAGERRRWTLPLRPAGETCTITFQTSPLISPDALIGNGDVRELGVRVIDFRFLSRAG